jgi:hypothetical protein
MNQRDAQLQEKGVIDVNFLGQCHEKFLAPINQMAINR